MNVVEKSSDLQLPLPTALWTRVAHKTDGLHFTCRPDNIAAVGSLRHEEYNSCAAFLCYGQQNVCFVQRLLRNRLGVIYSVLWLRFSFVQRCTWHVYFISFNIRRRSLIKVLCKGRRAVSGGKKSCLTVSETFLFLFSSVESWEGGGEGGESFTSATKLFDWNGPGAESGGEF